MRKIETVKLAGYCQWGILVDNLLDCDISLSNTENEAFWKASDEYPTDKVFTTKDPEHYSNQ